MQKKHKAMMIIHFPIISKTADVLPSSSIKLTKYSLIKMAAMAITRSVVKMNSIKTEIILVLNILLLKVEL